MPPDEDTQVIEPVQDTADTAASETAQTETQEQTETVEQAEAEQTNALQEAAAKEPKEPEKPAKNPIKPFQSRIDELTRNWRGTERELEAAQARIRELEARSQQPEGEQQAQQQPGTVPADMVDRLAETRAAQIAAQRQFDNDCNLTFMKGKAAYPDFEEALATFSSLGGLQREVVEDALATDNPQDVLYALGKDPDEAMRVLRLSPKQRVAEFTKMLLKTPAKPAVSKAAAPIRPVGGSAKKEFDYADDAADDAEWQAKRNAERRAAGKI